MTEVTVPVPAERVSEFYKFFAAWLDGEVPAAAGAEESVSANLVLTGWSMSTEDEELAVEIWGKLTKPAKALLGVLMDQPDAKITSEALAERAGIAKGSYGVAGVIGAPMQRARSVGRGGPLHWEAGEEGGPSRYWMDAATAACFAKARLAASE